MPIYEYRCTNGHLTERFQRMSDPPLERCDVCEAAVQKVLHPVAIHFKGSGFYNTDYGKGKGAKVDGKGEGGESGSEGTKSETAGASTNGDGASSTSGSGKASESGSSSSAAASD